ncbi:MAG TPA: hypothetical protein VK797_02275 [Tepidisphaeraceae bacterium]|jgi:hypothetical protein|nr:hypothetical protein [Tepidisphaeraceae bacterium]
MFEYYGKIQGVRGNLMGLPAWARGVLFVVSLPGIVLLALSIAAVICSLAALLLVTVPVYSLLRMVTQPMQRGSARGETMAMESPGRRHVDVKIVE